MSYLATAKKAAQKLKQGSQVVDSVEAEKGATAETLATQVLAECDPLEAELIVRAWRDIMGVTNLNPETVRLHLEALRQWQSRWHEYGRN